MLDFLFFQLKARPALVIFFTVFLLASIPLLFYYKRKNPHPRFQPSAGEMTLVSIFAVGLSFGLAMLLSSAFDHEHNLRNMDGKPQDEDPAYSEIKRDKNDNKKPPAKGEK